MSVLFEHRDEFDDRNAFLQVLLGLLACAHEIDGLLPMLEGGSRRHERDSRSAMLLSPTKDDEPLDDTLCLYLGLASLSRTVLAHAGNAAVTQEESTPPPAGRDDRPRQASRKLLEL